MAAIMAVLRRATAADVPLIQRLINRYAERGDLLPRALGEIYDNLRDYFVVDSDGEIVACAACHVHWQDLAEVKSLAVEDSHRGQGWAKRLLEVCLEDARSLGLGNVFALTYVPEFFERQGFARVDKSTLPHKIWHECTRCPKFPDCGEVAVTRTLKLSGD
jgi:amino-acid N-acetyltransferase